MGRHRWIAREGHPFIIIAALVAVGVALIQGACLSLLFFLLFVLILNFFRNPERIIPEDPNIILCPADGKVVAVEEIEESRFLPGRCRRVCIFMNPFNVHVNRAPMDAVVAKIQYNPGRFGAAFSPKASLENEQSAMTLDTPHGRIVVNQIAGLLVRRIVLYVTVGDALKRGQRFGMISFGSRVDIYFPTEWKVPLRVGQKALAGETPLAYIK